jgi:hypothetical protein
MATLEYWIQLENRPWDASPHDIDRITGRNLKDVTGKDPVDVTTTSPGTGVSKTRKMYNPLRDSDGNVKDAMILRRYKPPAKADRSDAWTVPDDRKVNSWDLNEVDPSDNGTMGTIPGPVIECNVGDTVVVNFRNHDMRTRTVHGMKEVCFHLPFGGDLCFNIPTVTQEPIEIEKRVHSLHPHGFVFKRHQDGAYPLSPPDPAQPVPATEAAAWASVPGFSGTLKQGDRVPPGGTFQYTWQTVGWPTTAGVWLYHDHSICDMENVELGAIGIIVIHNPADTAQEVDIRDATDPMQLDPAFLPGQSSNGSPVFLQCFPFPTWATSRSCPPTGQVWAKFTAQLMLRRNTPLAEPSRTWPERNLQCLRQRSARRSRFPSHTLSAPSLAAICCSNSTKSSSDLCASVFPDIAHLRARVSTSSCFIP